ncbi:aryl-alcohol dehydrogenase-like predicted oxidoreductase [Hungatella effluvii]|uniref:Aryl-alcohol dehydrogenase-like predicted oxidoreductase n=1 Tax=Hungatella effluvii TaxID=1096246 RepID=A0A2V3Y8G5_9FIRM|nr:aldo/keto reductase [Hungatella effluvii]PXX55105.1 aryl-alcohol dehydrogenase-like predicted oxidoreductase [Hungatella effluvii]
MEYVKMGKTGLDVSRICLGCMSFGDSSRWIHSWTLGEEESRKIIKKALDLGINFFDTANVYGMGTSEEYLGRALKDYARREDVVIATKVSEPMRPGPNGRGLSRKAVLAETDSCLKRLSTDYIDLLYIHRWDYQTPVEETMEALNDLVRAGKVHYLGASSMYAWQFQKANYTAQSHGWSGFSAMQGHYNLLYREEEREMNPLCADMGAALIPYSPLAAGRLTRDWESGSRRFQEDQVARRKYDGTESTDRTIVERVAETAGKYGVTRSQIAVAWLWEKGVCAPVVGVTKERYLDDFAGALKVRLERADMQYLEEAYVPHRIVGHE